MRELVLKVESSQLGKVKELLGCSEVQVFPVSSFGDNLEIFASSLRYHVSTLLSSKDKRYLVLFLVWIKLEVREA